MNDQMTKHYPADENENSHAAKDEFVFESREQQKSPRLSHYGLTVMLAVMCGIPLATIFVLWQYLPPVFEGKLEANVIAEELPGADFYAIEYYKRPPVEGGTLIVQNKSDQDWTQLNIQINGNYQIYDTKPILAKQEKRYLLNRFVNRTGARFSLQYNELRRVRIYARRPTKDRATYYHEFPTHYPIPTSYWPSLILLGVFAILLLIAARVFIRMGNASAAE